MAKMLADSRTPRLELGEPFVRQPGAAQRRADEDALEPAEEPAGCPTRPGRRRRRLQHPGAAPPERPVHILRGEHPHEGVTRPRATAHLSRRRVGAGQAGVHAAGATWRSGLRCVAVYGLLDSLSGARLRRTLPRDWGQWCAERRVGRGDAARSWGLTVPIRYVGQRCASTARAARRARRLGRQTGSRRTDRWYRPGIISL
ncbi:MAG: hypothetical protein HYX51_05125 [Chloroflexi bacterium]|nr:hypothetical protein [Chloroflexota bacterium]